MHVDEELEREEGREKEIEIVEQLQLLRLDALDQLVIAAYWRHLDQKEGICE